MNPRSIRTMFARSWPVAVVAAIALWAAVPATAQVAADAVPLLSVTPDTGLVGGQTVQVLAEGLGAEGEEGAWCQGVSGPAGGADYCAPGTIGTGTLAADGSFGGPVRLQRFIYVPALPGWVDCATTATQICTEGAGITTRPGSGQGHTLAFAPVPDPPVTRGQIALSTGVVRPGAAVSVTGTGFRAGALIDVFQCAPGPAAPADPSSCALAGTSVTADGVGGFATALTLHGTITPPGASSVDCLDPAGPCLVVAAEAVDLPGTAVAQPVTIAVPPPPPPVIVPGTATVAEGATGTVDVKVPVTLSAPSANTVTAQWSTVYLPGGPGSQADPADDYAATSGTVTFGPGETAQTVSIQVKGDATFEPTEYFVVAFHSATNATIGGFWGLGFGGIGNDDPRPTIVPGTASVSEPLTGTAALEVPVTLTNPSAQTVTVQWLTAFVPDAPAGQADPDADYVPASGTVTFAPGETTKTVSLLINADVTVEPHEYFVVAFHSATNATIGGFWGLGFGGILPEA